VKVFELRDVMEQLDRTGQAYFEFLRVAAISTGLYALPAGGADPQQPHREDEVYHVVQGRAVLRVEDEDHPVEAGTIAFVAAQADHRFHTITEDLVALVYFAPAESE